MDTPNASLETLQDIKRMMERSRRFISLSGLSGVSAGICALAGAYVAHGWMNEFYQRQIDLASLRMKLVLLAALVLACALISSFYFTWQKANRNGVSVWDPGARKVLINLLIPLVAGALFIAGLVYHDENRLIAPATLVFYGLALVNASQYTLSDIRWLGFLEIILGVICIFYDDHGLYFWAFGFGLLHIVYGLIMWWKYDKK